MLEIKSKIKWRIIKRRIYYFEKNEYFLTLRIINIINYKKFKKWLVDKAIIIRYKLTLKFNWRKRKKYTK